MKSYNILKNRILFQKYKLIKIIGKGAFGFVFKGINIQNNSEISIKVEKKSSLFHFLETEFNFLLILKGYGIPEIKSYGFNNNFYFLIEELLGKNLAQIYSSSKSFSLKDIAMIAIQVIDRIEFIHSKYVIHRDIKPENFLLGYDNNSIIYLIDFGMARKYKSSRTGKHLKYSLTGKLFGTFRYLSYNASRGVEQSRRDDLESIGYMLVFLRNGTLPWKGLNLKGRHVKTKYYHSLNLKKSIAPEDLCKNLPQEFAEYVRYCRNLGFEDDPNYNYLRNLFKGLLIKMRENNDSNFTWNKKLIFFWNKKSKEDNIQYHNLLRRKESSHSRLFKAIKSAFNSKEKITKRRAFKTILFFEKNNNSFVKKRSVQLLDINNKLDGCDYSKDNISFNSNCSLYNMKLSFYRDLDKTNEKNSNQKKNSINKINIKKGISSNNFQCISLRQNYNLKENNKRKINQDNIKNNKNLNIMINQNLNNSTRNITHHFTNIINNDNKLSEENSFNKNIMTKKMDNIKYKFINKRSTNSYKKGKLSLYKPNLYKSKIKKLSFCSRGNDSISGLIKKMKFSEYKPIYNNKEKSDILYNNKNNISRKIKINKSYNLFNLNKELNNMNNSLNNINKIRREEFHYKYSDNNILKYNNIYNISENMINSNSRERDKYLYNSVLSKIDNNRINFGLKSKHNSKIIYKSLKV